MTRTRRENWISCLLLLGSVFVFYPELFFVKSAFLIRDHIHQHYPWAILLSESVKSFHLPFWTPDIHCGFPIAAESQIGIFYPINLILYFFLPVQAAYAYQAIVHYLISGIATYFYIRQMKGSAVQSFVTAFIFLFGASYGGAYYNITSLQTIAWFPLALFLFEKIYETHKWRYVFMLGTILGFSLIAGYLQVAALAIFIFSLYVSLRVFFFSDSGKSKLMALVQFLAALVVSCFVALPQLILTFELAVQSSRMDLAEEYAYVGSMSPLAIFTMVFPLLQGAFRGNSLYVGQFSLILILCAAYSKATRSQLVFRLWVTLGLISILLALGQWSPLYVALIKLSHFYSFRTPAKFIIFICFALAVLVGVGFDAAWRAKETAKPSFSFKNVARTFSSFIFVFAAGALSLYFLLTRGREQFMRAGEWFIQKFVHGRPGHPHSMSVYSEKLASYFDRLLTYFSIHDFWVVWCAAMILIGLIFSFTLSKSIRLKKVWLVSGFIFLAVDLYGFAYRDMKRDFDTYAHALIPPPTVERLMVEHAEGKVSRLYGFRPDRQTLPIIPSANMLYGIEDIGAYSPFVLKRYHESIGLLGNVDDSNHSFALTSDYLFDRLKLLDALDVSHILSPVVLKHPDFKLLIEDKFEGAYLYESRRNHARAFFVARVEQFNDWQSLKEKLMAPGFDPREVLLLETTELEKIPEVIRSSNSAGAEVAKENSHWKVRIKEPGFFVLTNTMYPGWRVRVNGEERPILRAYGLFQAVYLNKAGEYEIEFQYVPFSGANK